ncbi:2-dehydropantoate 2-reductase [Melittangium boletus DSM 14713]|uniref:2-dehydropantoate 2-reductase n=1 Tax=Melittangium boletus DSM 14713 TaxID=1294270 RepID=A0A250IJV5_9BACT|nr:2-dehydropantoate 2-reductase [Melittangium boletus DSM 14713]
MKVAIVGPGSIGSTFAFHLARAGHDVTVVARGARLAQLEKDRAILKAQVIPRALAALRTAVRSRSQPVGRPPSRRNSVSAGPSSRPSSARSSSVRTGRPRFRSTSSVVTSPGSK